MFSIPLYRPSLGGNEKTYVNDCLDSTWISSRGPYVERFEREFATSTEVPYATSCCNGTVAIHLALLALGIGPGDEVLVPSLTYVASVNPIKIVGAKPVFVDIDPDTLQMNPGDAMGKVTSRTRAIIVVHLYGAPSPMQAIRAFCDDHNLLLLEDCAEAFGARICDRHVGNFGDVATYSFFGNKTITTGEGGMVVSRRREVIDAAYRLKTQGVAPDRAYWHTELGYNYRMTNICAALGLAQLESAARILRRKRDIALRYQRAFETLPVRSHREQRGTTHSFWLCSILVEDAADRDALREHLATLGIETRPFFSPAHKLPHLESGEQLPVSEDVSSRGINLPSYPDLEPGDQDLVIAGVKSFFGSPAA